MQIKFEAKFMNMVQMTLSKHSMWFFALFSLVVSVEGVLSPLIA